MFRTKEHFIPKVVAAGAIGVAVLTACGGTEAAPKHTTVTEQTSTPSPIPASTSSKSSLSPTATPTNKVHFSQDYIDKLEQNTNYDDAQVMQLQGQLNTIASTPQLLQELSAPELPSSTQFRTIVGAIATSANLAFQAGDPSIAGAIYSYNSKYNDNTFEQGIESNIQTALAEKQTDPSLQYSCSVTLAIDPQHVFGLQSSAFANAVANAPDQAYVNANNDDYVGFNLKCQKTDNTGILSEPSMDYVANPVYNLVENSRAEQEVIWTVSTVLGKTSGLNGSN